MGHFTSAGPEQQTGRGRPGFTIPGASGWQSFWTNETTLPDHFTGRRDRLFLFGYMRRFLLRRNQVLKNLAESEDWRKYVAAG